MILLAGLRCPHMHGAAQLMFKLNSYEVTKDQKIT